MTLISACKQCGAHSSVVCRSFLKVSLMDIGIEISLGLLGKEPLVTTQIFPSNSALQFHIEKYRVRLQVIAGLD